MGLLPERGGGLRGGGVDQGCVWCVKKKGIPVQRDVCIVETMYRKGMHAENHTTTTTTHQNNTHTYSQIPSTLPPPPIHQRTAVQNPAQACIVTVPLPKHTALLHGTPPSVVAAHVNPDPTTAQSASLLHVPMLSLANLAATTAHVFRHWPIQVALSTPVVALQVVDGVQ